MKLTLFWVIGLTPLGVVAQQPATVYPRGNVVVVQQSALSSSQANVTQIGTGNVATIQQGIPDSTGRFTHSVVSTQTAGGQTLIRQTQDGHAIYIHQTGPETSKSIEKSGKPK